MSSAIDLKADFTKTVEVTAATTTGGCATGDASPGAAVEQSSMDMDNQKLRQVRRLYRSRLMTWLFWRERKRKQAESTWVAAHNFGPSNDTSAYYEQKRKPPRAPQTEAPLQELSQDNQTR